MEYAPVFLIADDVCQRSAYARMARDEKAHLGVQDAAASSSCFLAFDSGLKDPEHLHCSKPLCSVGVWTQNSGVKTCQGKHKTLSDWAAARP